VKRLLEFFLAIVLALLSGLILYCLSSVPLGENSVGSDLVGILVAVSMVIVVLRAFLRPG
jgi:hypothetical protein